jgi:mycothiol system anti-sigma-R factor
VKCSEVLQLVTAAIDGELDREVLEEVNRHFDRCTQCREEFDLERMTKYFVRKSIPLVPAPRHLLTGLRLRIADENESAKNSNPPRSRWTSRPVTVLVGFAAMVVLLLFIPSSSVRHLHSEPLDSDFVHQSYNNFDDVVSGKIVPEISSSDPAVVKSFLSSRTSRPVSVPHLRAYNLVGGMASRVNHEPVVHLVYRNNQEVIYLYEVSWRNVAHGCGLHLSPAICQALRQSGWYSENHVPDCSLIVWLKDSSLCCAVAPIRKDKLLTCLMEGE